jgi:hypothetical protein
MRLTPAKLLLGFAFLLFTLPLSATERGVKRVEIKTVVGKGVKLEGQLLVTKTGIERMSADVPFDDRLLLRMF